MQAQLVCDLECDEFVEESVCDLECDEFAYFEINQILCI